MIGMHLLRGIVWEDGAFRIFNVLLSLRFYLLTTTPELEISPFIMKTFFFMTRIFCLIFLRLVYLLKRNQIFFCFLLMTMPPMQLEHTMDGLNQLI